MTARRSIYSGSQSAWMAVEDNDANDFPTKVGYCNCIRINRLKGGAWIRL